MSINDKIKQVLTIKNLSPSYLADDIGVQRSSISHILSGRNRPSLDIIQKIVRRFPEFSYEWFLDADIQLSSTDDDLPANETATKAAMGRPSSAIKSPQPQLSASFIPQEKPVADDNGINIPKQDNRAKPTIDRILIFYTDGTFREYIPATL